MENKNKIFILSSLSLILICLLLTHPQDSLTLSLSGLQLWLNKMIPALLPFMILSGIMVRLNLTEHFVKLLSPILTPLLQINLNGIYVMVMGFLCGFPMGAKVIADLYSAGRLSKKEASFLLSFCNSIGPVYFVSFVLPTLGLSRKLPYILGMYALPFCYGIFLRYTLYRSAFSYSIHPRLPDHRLKKILSAAEASSRISLLDALDDSILSGLYSIAKLGGYMILFNILNLLPQAFLPGHHRAGPDPGAAVGCFLEITGGISRMGDSSPLTVLLLLPFGGLSCIAQTYSMIKNTDLSLQHYILHKIVLTGLTGLYYFLWYLLFPSTFLL